MLSSIRDSLTWLHTWGGVFLGSVLFAVFWMGTLSVFDREIDRWMNPESRLKTLNENFSLDVTLEKYLPPEVNRWEIVYPSERDKVLRLFYIGNGGYERILAQNLSLKVGDGLQDFTLSNLNIGP